MKRFIPAFLVAIAAVAFLAFVSNIHTIRVLETETTQAVDTATRFRSGCHFWIKFTYRVSSDGTLQRASDIVHDPDCPCGGTAEPGKEVSKVRKPFDTIVRVPGLDRALVLVSRMR